MDNDQINIVNLNDDILLKIFKYLGNRDTFNFASRCKYLYNFLSFDILWINKIKIRYRDSIKYRDKDESFKDFYFKLSNKKWTLEIAIQFDNLGIFKWLLSNISDELIFDKIEISANALLYGSFNILNFLMENQLYELNTYSENKEYNDSYFFSKPPNKMLTCPDGNSIMLDSIYAYIINLNKIKPFIWLLKNGERIKEVKNNLIKQEGFRFFNNNLLNIIIYWSDPKSNFKYKSKIKSQNFQSYDDITWNYIGYGKGILENLIKFGYELPEDIVEKILNLSSDNISLISIDDNLIDILNYIKNLGFYLNSFHKEIIYKFNNNKLNLYYLYNRKSL